MEKTKSGTPWWVPGDINGFFGLFSNSLTNFMTAIGLLSAAILMPAEIVFGKIVPAAALSVGLGNVILAFMAKRMSVREQRSDVTAMPYGLSVPHYFAVAFGIILPVYAATHDWMAAWATGMVWNFIQGIIMLIGSFCGATIKKYLPRAAMLGALAGFAITFIAGNPLGEVFAAPYIGLTCFAVLMVGWFSGKRMPFGLPAGAFAIGIGTVLAWVTGYMNPAEIHGALADFNVPFPSLMMNLFKTGFEHIGPFLSAAIPLGIYDFLESLDNLESADAAGEHYSVTLSMSVPAILTILGSFLGSVFPTIIYIGHPGWKATGARIGYSLATAAGILILSFTGLLELVSAVIPLAALLPILVYIGMVMGSQAFSVAPKRHMPAVIFAFIPFIGSFLVSKINSSLTAINAALAASGTDLSVVFAEKAEGAVAVSQSLLSGNGVPYLGWQRLSQGDFIISMLLCSAVIYIIDRKYLHAAAFSGLLALLSFFGIIHAATFGPNSAPQMTIGYLCMVAALLVFNFYRKHENEPLTEEEAQ